MDADGAQSVTDAVAREEPLEIRIEGRPVAITMRTPGHDLELAASAWWRCAEVTAPWRVSPLSMRAPRGEQQQPSVESVEELLMADLLQLG